MAFTLYRYFSVAAESTVTGENAFGLQPKWIKTKFLFFFFYEREHVFGLFVDKSKWLNFIRWIRIYLVKEKKKQTNETANGAINVFSFNL